MRHHAGMSAGAPRSRAVRCSTWPPSSWRMRSRSSSTSSPQPRSPASQAAWQHSASTGPLHRPDCGAEWVIVFLPIKAGVFLRPSTAAARKSPWLTRGIVAMPLNVLQAVHRPQLVLIISQSTAPPIIWQPRFGSLERLRMINAAAVPGRKFRSCLVRLVQQSRTEKEQGRIVLPGGATRFPILHRARRCSWAQPRCTGLSTSNFTRSRIVFSPGRGRHGGEPARDRRANRPRPRCPPKGAPAPGSDRLLPAPREEYRHGSCSRDG